MHRLQCKNPRVKSIIRHGCTRARVGTVTNSRTHTPCIHVGILANCVSHSQLDCKHHHILIVPSALLLLCIASIQCGLGSRWVPGRFRLKLVSLGLLFAASNGLLFRNRFPLIIAASEVRSAIALFVDSHTLCPCIASIRTIHQIRCAA